MKLGSTIFLRVAIGFMAALVLGLCIFAVPEDIGKPGSEPYLPFIIGIYLTAVPFFIALYQCLRLLHYIDHHKAFSSLSITALKNIKYNALIISGLYVLGLPYSYMIAQANDAPGMLAINLIIAGASFSVAMIVAVLQKLLQNAIDLKSENDLTV